MGSLVFAPFLPLFLRASDAPNKATARDAELLAKAKDPVIVKDGKATYTSLCLACHGAEQAKSDAPSNLFDSKWYHGGRPSEIERTILKGVIDKGMPGWGEVLPENDTTAVTAYLLSLPRK
jgi:cytochrome c oxidase cbb3-type subunit 3